jgi:hypothetical protein
LLVFTEDELRLSAAELATASKGGLFPDSPFSTAFPDLAGTQSKTTMTVTLLARQAAMLDTWKPGTGTPPATRKIVTGIIRSVDDDPNDPLIPNPDDGTKPTDPATLDMVFVPTDVFSALFCSYGDNGMRQTPAGGVPDLSRYKYLAHARQVNTVQMADNGAQNGTQAGTQDEQGLFSIIVSHRTGPLPGIPRLIPIPQTDFSTTPGPRPAVVLPHSVIVHLVSLEGIENYIRLPITESRVGLVSLYSWTYTCLPPESVNFVDSMRAIGFQVLRPDYALRPPTALLNNLPAATTNGAADVIGQRLRQRANDGFAFIRHLTSTGEETSAFFRGALTPNLPQVPLDANWPAQVNNSSGLDILDPVLGIMDITYSSAWELGRTLAVADKSFTAALSRVRRATQKQAADATKAALLAPLFRTKIDILTRLPSTVSFVSSLVKKMQSGTVSPSPPSSPPSQPPNPASGASLQAFKTNVRTTLKALGSAAAPSGTSDPDPAPYNEYNVPQNSDWALVLKWILDRMFLYNIPPNYLITDPSHLPTETIRFFYIDPNWMNAESESASNSLLGLFPAKRRCQGIPQSSGSRALARASSLDHGGNSNRDPQK